MYYIFIAIFDTLITTIAKILIQTRLLQFCYATTILARELEHGVPVLAGC